MSIEANFNKLYFFKKLNNYFNRKVIGSDTLTKYIGAPTTTNKTVFNSDFHVEDDGNYYAYVDLRPYERVGIRPDISWTIQSGNADITFYSPNNVIKVKRKTAPCNVSFLITFSANEFELRENVNFNPNDSVMTEIVINNLSFEPDYCLVVDSNNNIVSRWFVLEEQRTRGGQSKYSLRRDVIYDYLDTLMEAPIFVQKAMLEDDDPFIVNDEGMSVNQIKKQESIIADFSDSAWAIIYFARNMTDQTITLKRYNTGSSLYTLQVSENHVRSDQPFDMFALPLFGSLNWIDTDGTGRGPLNSATTLTLINEIARELDANCYDIQLLPFCPFIDYIDSDRKLDLRKIPSAIRTEHIGFDYIMNAQTSTKAFPIVYIQASSFELPVYTWDEVKSDLTKKESSNLELYRFVSPNYQGSFDFNLAKNDDKKIENLTAYCTYKPYTPFIKISPTFKFLYGAEYKDSRGLILGGDFSITRITDAWETFQLNNKNYQNIFNREIQNMDFTYSIQERNALVSGGIGILQGVASGAAGGAMVGGGYGAIAGAAVGTIASTVGLAVDLDTMARQYQENRSLAIDKFNYQLGNIKALPYTLTKVGTFDYISKIWPIVEKYSCTDKELQAFKNKIKYESMTVMRIDKISNFYHHFEDLCYFKGELIRNEEIAADNHILMAIYSELLKGVYL